MIYTEFYFAPSKRLNTTIKKCLLQYFNAIYNLLI